MTPGQLATLWKAIDPAGIMGAHKRDRIHAAIHCVCIWNRDSFLRHAIIEDDDG